MSILPSVYFHYYEMFASISMCRFLPCCCVRQSIFMITHTSLTLPDIYFDNNTHVLYFTCQYFADNTHIIDLT